MLHTNRVDRRSFTRSILEFRAVVRATNSCGRSCFRADLLLRSGDLTNRVTINVSHPNACAVKDDPQWFALNLHDGDTSAILCPQHCNAAVEYVRHPEVEA